MPAHLCERRRMLTLEPLDSRVKPDEELSSKSTPRRDLFGGNTHFPGIDLQSVHENHQDSETF
jgi:hypothetical protein